MNNFLKDVFEKRKIKNFKIYFWKKKPLHEFLREFLCRSCRFSKEFMDGFLIKSENELLKYLGGNCENISGWLFGSLQGIPGNSWRHPWRNSRVYLCKRWWKHFLKHLIFFDDITRGNSERIISEEFSRKTEFKPGMPGGTPGDISGGILETFLKKSVV